MGPFRKDGNLLFLKMQVRAAARRKGHSWQDADTIVSPLTADTVEQARQLVLSNPQQFGTTKKAFEAGVRKLGDGSLLQLIMDFIKSPAGQALIQALLTLLLGFLGPNESDEVEFTDPTGPPQFATPDVEDFSPPPGMRGSAPQPMESRLSDAFANIDMEAVKKGLKPWLPMMEMFAARTETKFDDAAVAFIKVICGMD